MDIICQQWTEPFEVKGYHVKDILTLIQEAYKGRAKEGISFATLSYTIDDFLAERTEADYWFLAFDDDNKLYGTARLTIFNNHSAEVCNFAVSPLCQGRHIGAKLLQEIKRFGRERGLSQIISFTAMNAKSSVRCHCNNGFIPVKIFIYPDQSYSSYAFTHRLTPASPQSRLLLRLRYTLSYLKYILCKTADGRNTFVGELYFALKRKK